MTGVQTCALPICFPVTIGAVFFRDTPLERFPGRALARSIGVLLQDEAQTFWGTVLEYVLLGRFPHAGSFAARAEDREAARQALVLTGMAELSERPLATLSGGERQRVRIATLLAQAPQIYFLDEPLQHLDLPHQLAAMKLFRQLAQTGHGVVMVLHEPLWASRFCDRALLLYDDGRAAGGAASALLTKNNLEDLYQCRLEELTTAHGNCYVPDLS